MFTHIGVVCVWMLHCQWNNLVRYGWYIPVSNHNKQKATTTKRIPHDDVIKWKYLPRYWPFVRGIHQSLMFSLTCVWINGWVNNREAGDLRRYRAYYDVIVMRAYFWIWLLSWHQEIRTHNMLTSPNGCGFIPMQSTNDWREYIVTYCTEVSKAKEYYYYHLWSK